MHEGNSGDTFTGYLLRIVEEKLGRIERKLDALGQQMTPEERAAFLAKLDADSAKVDKAANDANALAEQLNKTGA